MTTDVRVRGLAAVDPLAVPLPHGTEVVTRVDRVHGDRHVPQGAVGRVVGSAGDQFEVQIVGAGVFRYARDELVPRKTGQVRWAQRRVATWDALRPCVVLEATVGSRAWGLADEGSDTDVRGVFVLPFSWTGGLAEPPGELVSADGSATYWEVGKAIRQALRADPNTLEMLFVPSARPLDPMGERLLETRGAFVSAEIYGSFGRYALSQVAKLRQSLRLAEHRAIVLDWLREDPPPSLDETAARLAARAVRDAPSEKEARLRAKEYVKQLYASMYDQGLIVARDFASLVHFAREGSADFDLPRELRPKNAYNLLRLILVAAAWLRTGHVDFVVREPVRERLLAIKRGEVSLADVLADAEAMAPALEEARRVTPLPRRADLPAADALLRLIREEAARRALTGAAGPFGLDAPPVPPVDWEDPA